MTTISSRGQEVVFGVGTFAGTLLFATGVATYILGVSTGMRSGSYLSPALKWGLVAAGAVLLTVGAVTYVRGARYRNDAARRIRRVGGGLLALVGMYAVGFALSPETTLAAPFLTSPRQKLLLFVLSFLAVSFGVALIRGSARVIGW